MKNKHVLQKLAIAVTFIGAVLEAVLVACDAIEELNTQLLPEETAEETADAE